ncbi:MAG: thermonuclease family protein [Candidatus Aenigmatarchaeota archaeon]
MKKLFLFLPFFILILLLILISFKNESRERATIARVIDGDTVELANGKKIRLLGIDAPEEGHYYFKESKEKLKGLVEGKTAFLEKDISNTDKSGRLLRYLFVDDVFVNLEMIRGGYANVYIIPPNTKYEKDMIKAEEDARKREIGIWKRSNKTYAACIKILKFNYDAKGEDSKNLNDEYVTFENICSFPINFEGWTIRDRSFNYYKFPKFILNPKSNFTLYSGSGKDSNLELYWNSKFSIWNNEGDSLYLRDKEGDLILIKTY